MIWPQKGVREPSLSPSLALLRCHVPVIPTVRDHWKDKLSIGRHLREFDNSLFLHVLRAKWNAGPIIFG